MATVEERVTTLETEFRTELRHLATKADMATLRGELQADIATLRSELQDRLNAHLRWVIGVQLLGLVVVATIVGLS